MTKPRASLVRFREIIRNIKWAFKKSLYALLNLSLTRFGWEVVDKRRLVDFCLHEYTSYSQYEDIQIFHNKRKLEHVWADKTTLRILCDELKKEFPNRSLKGICHGTRNGFEQKFIGEYAAFEVIGTEISDTADGFDKTIRWDFHDVNEQWVSKFDFVYSNSLDQAWNPRTALVTWLNQLNDTGVLVIEHTEAHGPEGASEMDPFGVRPTVVPYVLSEWFGYDVSMRFVKSRKDNNGLDVWLFFIKKNLSNIN